MPYGSAIYGTGLYGTADTATQTASLSAQDGDTSEAAGSLGVDATLSTQDADDATVAGTRQADAALSTQDADNSAVAGATGTTQMAALSAQDGDTSAVAGTRIITASVSTQDADTATAAGTLGVDAAVSGQDADAASATGSLTLDATLSAQDADTSTFAGIQGAASDILAPATVTVEWDDSATHQLSWDDSATIQIDMADNDITQQTVPAAGENIERTIEVDEDGSDKDISGASLEWYLVPSEDSADGNASVDHDTTGVDLNISDAAAGEITLSVDQGVTDGLSGRWWQRLKVDDTGDGLQIWGGTFRIEQA